ncbi:BICD family-like cargo adapter 1 isoform X1 [Alosa alosa]|uniref:BICD family-like cargo adapter 1 isoform X1 n=1 Tax=Alosa alosa TaxID=278164 RepID=UPI002015236C|nr:BICD family-like cargo adapter 1 isoform X1 [Alosa alosa]
MSRVVDVSLKSHKMGLEEDFYSFDFDNEEIPVYQNQDEILAALRQKEEEVILAAQLGNALLLENRQLKEEADKLHEQYTDKLEVLEQGRHELRLKLEGCQAQWEGQVSELEGDVRELSGQAQQLRMQLSQEQRDRRRDQQEHSELSQHLRQQLQDAMETERALSAELQTLRQEVRESGHSRPQDEELLSAMREQVARLNEKERTLEQRLQCVCEENSELKGNLSSLHTRLALHEQQSQQHIQQLAEAWREVEVARGRTQELQSQVEALQEEASMQEGSHGNASLLSELELSLDTLGLGTDREQLTQEVESILRLLLPLTQNPQEVGGGQNDLQGMVAQLKNLAQELTQQHSSQQQLSGSIVEVGSDQSESPAQIQDLKDQVCVLQEENCELRLLSECCRVEEEHLHQAIRDRDEAISKKTLMEAELVRSKNDMMSLNNQLLEAIQRKLELSQELEAWQDDIQVILNQQLRTQQQCDQSQRKPVASHPLSFLRRSRRLSNAPVCVSQTTTTTDRNGPSPWRDWLKRGK